MIEKNIIHIAPGKDVITDEFQKNIQEIVSKNPTWTHHFFSDVTASQFVEKNYAPQYVSALNRIDPTYGPARSDLLRYLILYKIGGIYLDNKSGLAKPLDEMILPSDEFIIAQWENSTGEIDEGTGLHPELDHIHGGEYINWAMISRAKHPFLRLTIDLVMKNIREYSEKSFGVGKNGTLRTTGPIAMTLAIAPQLDMHPHRLVRRAEFGLLYATFGNSQTHTISKKVHYSRLIHPIVLPSEDLPPLQFQLAKLWRNIALGIAWLRHQNRRRRYRSRLKRGINIK